MRKPRVQEVQELLQGHKGSKWQNWGSQPYIVTPCPVGR